LAGAHGGEMLLNSRLKTYPIAHIHRKGNKCEYLLASRGIRNLGSFWWVGIPSMVSRDFFRDRFGLPSFRFFQGFWHGPPLLFVLFRYLFKTFR